MTTGYFTFKWNDPSGAVQEVYVTGTFDAWGKSTQLFREGEGEAFVARVELPVEKTQYKFVVDGEWVIDTEARKEFEDGIENNILIDEDFEGHGKKAEGKVEDADKGDGDTETISVEAVQVAAVETLEIASESSFDSEVADPNALNAKPVHVDAVDMTSEAGVASTETTDDTGEIIENITGAADDFSAAASGVIGASPFEPTVIETPNVSESAGTEAQNDTVSSVSLLPTTALADATKGATISSASPNSSTAALAANVPKDVPAKGTPTECPYNAGGIPKAVPAPKDRTPKAAQIPTEMPAACPYNPDGSPKTPDDPAPIPKETPESCPCNPDGTPKAALFNADGTPKENPEESPARNGTPLEFFKNRPTVVVGVATIVGFFLTKKYLFPKRS